MAFSTEESSRHCPARTRGSFYSFIATLLLWSWFLGVGIFFVVFLYVPAFVIFADREQIFQRLNARFFSSFLALVRWLFPMHEWFLDKQLAQIKGAVIVCNHRSYLDPLILISLFSRQKTIVKTRFFSFPVFGWLLRVSGYLPATSQGRFAKMMLARMETMASFLQQGGIVFIFPEGTRARDEHLVAFQPGAFKIARLCQAPVAVVKIENSDALFPPGRFLFSGSSREPITLSLVGILKPDYCHDPPSASQLKEQVCSLLSPEPVAATAKQEG